MRFQGKSDGLRSGRRQRGVEIGLSISNCAGIRILSKCRWITAHSARHAEDDVPLYRPCCAPRLLLCSALEIFCFTTRVPHPCNLVQSSESPRITERDRVLRDVELVEVENHRGYLYVWLAALLT